jgi:putative N6-adenine-specific DNA methylase
LPSRETFFVPCAPGLEPLLHAEIRALRVAHIERQVGGVRFEGTIADARKANLELRTAVRVLQRVARFQARDADELYAGARAVDWSRFLGPEGKLRVDAHSNESVLEHTLFVEQKVKDAVVDSFRELHGRRPDVSKDDPDLPVHVHLFRDRCTLSVDTSGDSLHLRGWRRFQGRAPLAETLAAGLVLASEWDRRAPLLDPFCGSGTIPIEAALLACDVAPGLARRGFAFERWPGHDAAAWQHEREAARARIRPAGKRVLLGSDADASIVSGARENARAADVADAVSFDVARAETFAPRPGWNAWIVTNPPYGDRIGDERQLVELYRRFGAILRERCGGYRVALLSGNPRLARALGLEPRRRVPLKNGGIDCELLLYEP